MFLDFTRKSYTRTFLLFLATLFALWGKWIFGDSKLGVPAVPIMPFVKHVYELAEGKGFLLEWLPLIVVVIFASFFLLYFILKHEILKERDYLVPFIFLLYSCSVPFAQPILLAEHIASLLCLFSINTLLSAYQEREAAKYIFISACWSGAASMLFPPAAMILLLTIFAVSFLKPFNWRDIFVALFGMLTPFVLVASTCYLCNIDLEPSVSVFISYFNPLADFSTPNQLFCWWYIPAGFILLLTIISMLPHKAAPNTKAARVLALFRTTLLFMILGVVIFPHMRSVVMPVIAAPAAAILLANFLSSIRSPRKANAVLILLILSFLSLQLFF